MSVFWVSRFWVSRFRFLIIFQAPMFLISRSRFLLVWHELIRWGEVTRRELTINMNFWRKIWVMLMIFLNLRLDLKFFHSRDAEKRYPPPAAVPGIHRLCVGYLLPWLLYLKLFFFSAHFLKNYVNWIRSISLKWHFQGQFEFPLTNRATIIQPSPLRSRYVRQLLRVKVL